MTKLPALAVVLAAVAGCAAPVIAHPSARHTAAASPVTQAAAAECRAFTTVSDRIAAATQGDFTNAAIMATLRRRDKAWNKALDAAARLADRPGVPTGDGNKARIVAVDIDEVALAMSQANVAAILGRPSLARKSWTEASGGVSATLVACA